MELVLSNGEPDTVDDVLLHVATQHREGTLTGLVILVAGKGPFQSSKHAFVPADVAEAPPLHMVGLLELQKVQLLDYCRWVAYRQWCAHAVENLVGAISDAASYAEHMQGIDEALA